MYRYASKINVSSVCISLRVQGPIIPDTRFDTRLDIRLVWFCSFMLYTFIVGRRESCQAFKWRMFKLCSSYYTDLFSEVMKDENWPDFCFQNTCHIFTGRLNTQIKNIYSFDHKYILAIAKLHLESPRLRQI